MQESDGEGICNVYYQPYSMYPSMYRASTDLNLTADLLKAINGEYSAIACYGRYAELASDPAEKRSILEIRKDEIRHYETFIQIFMSLTGRRPEPKLTEACAKDYVSGLEASIRDEQETVDFYLEVADKARDPYIKERFRRAAADEQNHAVWFLYFYTRGCCGK
jgi:rubrerythrin